MVDSPETRVISPEIFSQDGQMLTYFARKIMMLNNIPTCLLHIYRSCFVSLKFNERDIFYILIGHNFPYKCLRQTASTDNTPSVSIILQIILSLRPRPNVELFMRPTKLLFKFPKLSVDRLLGQTWYLGRVEPINWIKTKSKFKKVSPERGLIAIIIKSLSLSV